jgi:hypothetical protein
MRVVIHQPEYLPWIGFFDKIDITDTLVFFDHVQFERRGFQNRNKIKTSKGPMWLTVPIVRNFGDRIMDVKIEDRGDWRNYHLVKIEENYGNSQYFKDYKDFLKSVYSKEWESLCELNIFLTEKLSEILGLKLKTVRSSELDVKGQRNELLINVCKAVGADEYFSGAGAKGYMDLKLFEENGIKVIFHNFTHPVYNQLHGEFIPFMSVIDMIFNCGNSTMDMVRKFNPRSDI